jgi:hypothetical protein
MGCKGLEARLRSWTLFRGTVSRRPLVFVRAAVWHSTRGVDIGRSSLEARSPKMRLMQYRPFLRTHVHMCWKVLGSFHDLSSPCPWDLLHLMSVPRCWQEVCVDRRWRHSR